MHESFQLAKIRSHPQILQSFPLGKFRFFTNKSLSHTHLEWLRATLQSTRYIQSRVGNCCVELKKQIVFRTTYWNKSVAIPSSAKKTTGGAYLSLLPQIWLSLRLYCGSVPLASCKNPPVQLEP